MVTLLEIDDGGAADTPTIGGPKRRCGEGRRCCEWKSGIRSKSTPARFTSVSLP